MKIFSTRQVETDEEAAIVYGMRYDYFISARELDVGGADHVSRWLCEERDHAALQYATFAGGHAVGCFRIEAGLPETLRFGADWAFSDFLDGIPERIAIVSGLCTAVHLRDPTVIAHMVRESVALARDLALPHVFFEMCPDLWPLFHAAGLSRKGDALPHARTGLKTAVFQLDRRDRAAAQREVWSGSSIGAQLETAAVNDDLLDEATQTRRRFALVAGGR